MQDPLIGAVEGVAFSGSLLGASLLCVSDESVGVGHWGCICRLVYHSRISSSGFPLLSAEASEIMKSIGEAIQYLHSVNIAHRDVKVTLLIPHALGDWDSTLTVYLSGQDGSVAQSVWLVGPGIGDHKLSSEALFGCTQPYGVSCSSSAPPSFLSQPQSPQLRGSVSGFQALCSGELVSSRCPVQRDWMDARWLSRLSR